MPDTGALSDTGAPYGSDGRCVTFRPRAQLIQGPPAQSFSTPVHSVSCRTTTIVYVADRTTTACSIQLDGTFVREVSSTGIRYRTRARHGFALSRDPGATVLYVADEFEQGYSHSRSGTLTFSIRRRAWRT